MSKQEQPKKLTPAELVVARLDMPATQICEELGWYRNTIGVWIHRGGEIRDTGKIQQLLEFFRKKKKRITLHELTFGGVA